MLTSIVDWTLEQTHVLLYFVLFIFDNEVDSVLFQVFGLYKLCDLLFLMSSYELFD